MVIMGWSKCESQLSRAALMTALRGTVQQLDRRQVLYLLKRSLAAKMSESSASEWAGNDETLAELEAEQAKYAAELEGVRVAERAAASLSSDGDQSANLIAENERLKAELAAMTSASASMTKRRDEEDIKAELAKYTAENAKLTAALSSGVDLSHLSGINTSASVVAASRARMVAMVRPCSASQNCSTYPLGIAGILLAACRRRMRHG